MPNIVTIDDSITDAVDSDFDPTIGHSDEDSMIPCIDLFANGRGSMELVHVPTTQPFAVTTDYVRFDARGPREASELAESLCIGGTLYKLFIEVVDALECDRGILAACNRVTAHLDKTTKS